MSSWSEVFRCSVKGSYASVTKLKSTSGLNLVLIDVEGPLVNSYIALATEACDDDGLPHTLEHLVFLGSEDYPYKGILDIFANRCYASGTNAWTDIDNTVYTLSTAGPKGTLTLLPIYMDHILYPLMTEQGYITEVHHINGEGEDAGVIYSEMQGRENDAYSRCIRKLLQEIYNGTGYEFETGGIMENLRTSTSNEKIKNFHSQFYRPENITIIIAGQIDKDSVIKSLKPIEDKILKKNELNPPSNYVRPWQSEVPPLNGTKIIHHKYPDDTEESGRIMVGWRGPQVTNTAGYYEFTACTILMRYLCDTPIAPFQKALVEIENPYASDVSTGIIENSATLLMITLENVPLQQLDNALPELRKIISSLPSSTEFLDIDRIHLMINITLREFRNHMENSPHDTLTFICLSSILYSTTEKEYCDKLNKYDILKKLESEDVTWWENLFKKYFLKDFVAVIGRPSVDLMEQMAKEEADRIRQQIETLGENGLKEKADELEKAMKFNDREVPSDVIESVGVKDIDDLKRFSIEEWYSDGPECPYFDLKKLPFYARIHHMHSQFAYISLLLDTSNLTTEERFYLPLLLQVLTETSYNRNDCKMEFNVLVEEIERLTCGLQINIGTNGSTFTPGTYYNVIQVNAVCEREKYEEVIDLLWHILKKTIFERKRLLIVAQKMFNDISDHRRQGSSMATLLLKVMATKKDTNINCVNILQQYKFLNNVISILDKGDTNESIKIINTFEAIRSKIVCDKNIWLHFGADLKQHNYPADPWKVFSYSDNQCKPPFSPCGININYQSQLIDSTEIEGQGCIVGIGGLESTHLKQISKGPSSHTDPDLPALLVAVQYLIQTEGPMWKTIRGGGFAYGYDISFNPDYGWTNFSLFKATHAAKAYEKTKALIEPYLKTISWDNTLFMAAKSSLIFDIVKKEKSPLALFDESLIKFLKGVEQDYNLNLIKAIANVTEEDAFNTAKKWLPGLFDSKNTIVVTCNPAKVNEMKDSFDNMGYKNLKVYKSLDDSHLSPKD